MLAIVTTLFLPRIAKKGMFGDGLLYASMARNMSEGLGTFWAPYFSSSYWLEGIQDIYYENPPLMLWVQSLLFSTVGDHWWVEKLFCLLILMVNLYLIRFLWQTIFQTDLVLQQYWFLPVFCWYMLPVVVWGNVNNLMDNMLVTFCLLSVALIFKAIHTVGKLRLFFLLLSVLSIFGGILTKGPVALYPIALPFLYSLVAKDYTFKKMIGDSMVICLCTTLVFLGLLILNNDALLFFEQYWNQ
ncbi:MAG: glycosyltransferase family 39 protein, partial [Saprospiraceae bacterium]